MFKRVVIAFALAAATFAANALQATVIPSVNRVSTTVASSDMFPRDAGSGPRDVGIIVNSYVTSVTGAVTLTFKIQGKTPQGEYYDVLSLTPVAPVAATVNTLVLRPGITAVAGASAAAPLPPVFRILATTTSTGSSTFSIGVARTN